MSWNQIRSKIDCIVQYLWYSTICLREAKPNHHHYHNHQKAYFHSNRHKKRAENTFSVVLTFHHFQSFGFFEALLRYPLYSWILFQELLWYKKEKLELLGKSVCLIGCYWFRCWIFTDFWWILMLIWTIEANRSWSPPRYLIFNQLTFFG